MIIKLCYNLIAIFNLLNPVSTKEFIVKPINKVIIDLAKDIIAMLIKQYTLKDKDNSKTKEEPKKIKYLKIVKALKLLKLYKI